MILFVFLMYDDCDVMNVLKKLKKKTNSNRLTAVYEYAVILFYQWFQYSNC